MSTRVEMNNIRLEYPAESGKISVLDNAALSVPPGETLAITGPSGSGKTSLLLLLSGLQRPTSGEIFVGEKCIDAMDADALADWRSEHLGIVFQSFHLMPGLTALILIAFTTLFIGGLGIANSVRAYLDEKLSAIATLQTLGLRRRLLVVI